MSDVRYAVLFCGQIVPGITLDQVKSAFGELFGLTEEKLEQLFTQPKVVLKRDVSEQEAKRIAHGLRKIGMEVDLYRLTKQAVAISSPQASAEQNPPIKKTAVVASELALVPDESVAKLKEDQQTQQNKTTFTSSFSLVGDEPLPQQAEEAGGGAVSEGYNNEFVGAFDRPVVDKKSLPTTLPFVFMGKGEEYFKIWIVNILLSIVTLGIFSAWAKVRTNRYFYGNTFLDNSSFEYLADPIKILKGRLIAFFFLLIYVASDYISMQLSFICIGLLAITTPWIVMKAARFRNRNSAWRGIRFSFEGNLVGAAISYLLWPFLSIISLGWLTPFAMRSQTQYLIGKSRFGGEDIENTATISEFYKIFIYMWGIGLLGGLLVMGIGFFSDTLSVIAMFVMYFFLFSYYRVNMTNLKLNATTIGKHGLRADYELGSYSALVFTNIFLIICTLGLFYPFAKVRSAQYAADHITCVTRGSLDEFIEDQRDDVSAVGGEVGEFFDIDIGF